MKLQTVIVATLFIAVSPLTACPSATPADPPPADTPPADTPVAETADGGGGGDAQPGDTAPDVPPPTPKNACLELADAPQYQISARATLRWKRAMALEQDLLGALELEATEACAEVGFPGVCFGLHLVPLGGNEPVIATMYEPLPAPAASTALAVDRVIIAACGAAVDRDSTGTDPVIFKFFDLSAGAVTPDTTGLDSFATDMYQRFLARDPDPGEIDLLKTLAEPVGGTPLTARDFAKTACYAVASTTEFLFH